MQCLSICIRLSSPGIWTVDTTNFFLVPTQYYILWFAASDMLSPFQLLPGTLSLANLCIYIYSTIIYIYKYIYIIIYIYHIIFIVYRYFFFSVNTHIIFSGLQPLLESSLHGSSLGELQEAETLGSSDTSSR